MFSKMRTKLSTKDSLAENKDNTEKEGNVESKANIKAYFHKENTDKQKLQKAIDEADAVIIGAGAGLSAAAGFDYTGERFKRYFSDFAAKYGFQDMYSGGFYPYKTFEEHWAYWSRYIYINRYMDAPKPVYEELLELVKDKDYFVLTTNVDHCFQKAGFDKKRLFYTQGDYGLWQCSRPCHLDTYDNADSIRQMVLAQGYEIAEDGTLLLPADYRKYSGSHGAEANSNMNMQDASVETSKVLKMMIPTELVPHCPKCGAPMSMNLRCDETFVEDEGWHMAAERYETFLRRHKGVKTVFLELGTGYNTPGIIKYPFWKMTYTWPDAKYVCVNLKEAYAPKEIKEKSLCIEGDIGSFLH